ncbi:hypothetical protein OPKNFCMD_3795 [Methylobacterium crusticola]|uniref:Tetratricopeptide repeat protein n=1 Tax=Methylobacterium crusticola TaxID=1697972 RepID=A0ABQ4R0T7_9HYPH|nr:hypothetical protein [Methylobacterium crusticola]GJD51044.1 hypothetical protein OPKNFCMD_3795 [Methylobacterium crusticola]
MSGAPLAAAAGRGPDGRRGPAGWARAGADPVAAVKAAERLREDGDILEAAVILVELCRIFPDLPYGWREIAILRQRAGDAAGAARDLARAFAADPGDVLTLSQAVRQLAGAGRPDAAEACLAGFRPRDADDRLRADQLGQLLAFMRRHPEAEARALAMRVRTSPRHIGVDAVEALVAAALARRRPLSLIRLGDGEGAWIGDPDDEGGRYRALHRRNRKRILRTWFGGDDLIDRPDFLALRARLLAAVEEATILGVTYPERVRHEYGIASLAGVPCCTNVLACVAPLLGREGPAFCTHDIHLELHLSGALHRLLDAGAPVGVISCHPGLAGALARRPGVRVGASLLIPEEKRFTPVIGRNGTLAPHFPTVFHQVVARLREGDWAGMLWLVAAGYLGKLYCHEIARRGGVAVDIGSVADAWSGKATRPGLSDLGRYRL